MGGSAQQQTAVPRRDAEDAAPTKGCRGPAAPHSHSPRICAPGQGPLLLLLLRSGCPSSFPRGMSSLLRRKDNRASDRL